MDVPQLVAPGELGARTQLPSFVYLAGEHDLPAAATAIPWDPTSRVVVGELARSQGARVPGRMIASAKSWLCHPGVDRAAAILPWGAAEGPKLSPIDASSRVLAHVAAAWRAAQGTALADEDVIVTVPASFDEIARELTVDAAARAGLPQITLLEEPQAVFYAWIAAHDARARRSALKAGDLVLVCDVGGGTTDFTMIRVDEDGDGFERTAVGDHLLLGGDNVDIALARKVEARLGKLDAVQWHGLVHACRIAKEQFFTDRTIATRTITVAARGSKLIGATLKAELARTEVEELVVDGFFPMVAADARPSRARVGLQEFGLPYAADAAITRHLAAFLARHQVPRIDAVIFNGGAMTPAEIRARVLDQIAAWQDGARPRELSNAAPELAVAHGAAYYGKVRRGVGSRIRGGAARAFYAGVEGGHAVCVVPRGAEEGTEHELAQDFALVMNRPVSFRLYSSTSRSERPGDEVVATGADDLLELPPLVTVLRAPGRTDARVRLHAKLTALGTLELWCADTTSDARWRLTFDLRAGGDTSGGALDPNVEPAKDAVRASFGGTGVDPASLMKELERILDARRDEWSTSTIRALWDATNECEAARARSSDVEARWLNLAGFCLRPGVGAPLDDWRAKEMWKVFNLGLRAEKDEACRLAWWIVWRRIAGGLKRGQQEQIYDRVAPMFIPGTQQKAKWYRAKPSPQEAAEMWRTVASLERLTPAAKTKLGDALLDRLEKGRDTDVGFWAIGRLGARAPLYGPADAVVPPDVATRWIDRLLAMDWKQPERVEFPAAQLGRMTGDRARDIDDDVRARLAARLTGRAAKLVTEIVELEAREERVAFGDSLPTGLRRVSDTKSELQ
jgi:molecular chaperone DnaK (HSP70)